MKMKELSIESQAKNFSSLQAFKNDNSNLCSKKVIAKKGKELLFDQIVQVSISEHNLYFNVNIMWEDYNDTDFRALGLYGSYSTKYEKIRYQNEVLKIKTTDGIEISIK